MENDSSGHVAAQDLDLLAAAWCLTEAEIESVLRVPAGTVAAWRNSEPAPWSDQIGAQVDGLKRLQNAIWLHQLPPTYAAFWRRPWRADSPIGSSTPLAAIIKGGPATVQRITEFLVAAGMG